MDKSGLDWTELLRVFGPLAEKGPRSVAVAKAGVLDIIEAYHRRKAERAKAQTYETRRSRLTRIQKAAWELVASLVEAGPEIHEELRVVGECFRAPQAWTEDRARLGDIANLRRIGLWDGIEGLESMPAIVIRVASLHGVTEQSLGNSKLASRPGRGQKPITVGDATLVMYLVNECWDLLNRLGQKPAGGLTGLLSQVAAEVGSLATGEPWSAERVKREVVQVVRLRRTFLDLNQQLDETWMKAGSPLLRGSDVVDEEIQGIVERLMALVAESNGLLQAPHRVTAWMAHWRLRPIQTGSEQNPL